MTSLERINLIDKETITEMEAFVCAIGYVLKQIFAHNRRKVFDSVDAQVLEVNEFESTPESQIIFRTRMDKVIKRIFILDLNERTRKKKLYCFEIKIVQNLLFKFAEKGCDKGT